MKVAEGVVKKERGEGEGAEEREEVEESWRDSCRDAFMGSRAAE